MGDPLSGFCDTKFWDLNLTWYTNTPDFTQCFQNTVLVWVPFGFLILGLPFEIYEQRKPGKGQIPWNFYNISKLFFMVVLFGLVLTELIWMFLDHSTNQLSSDYISSMVIQLVGYLLVSIMIVSGRSNGLQSSMVLFFFWLLHFLGSLIIYYSMINKLMNEPALQDVVILGLRLSITPIVFLQVLLTFIADQVPEHLRYAVKEDICPEQRSSYLSQILFGWLDILLYRGYKKAYKQDELWKLEPDHRSDTIVKEFDFYWNKEIQKAEESGWDVTNKEKNTRKGIYEPAFMIALARSYWFSFFISGVQKTISDLLSFVSPLMLNYIISFVSSGEPLWKGIFYSFVVFGASELQSLFQSQYYLRTYVIAMKVRMSIISAVYRKSLKITNKERQESTVGEIVNLMSIDTQRFVDLMPYIILIYAAPLQIALSLYFLSNVLGISVIAGFVVMLLMIPANAFIAAVTRKLQVKDMIFKDQRTKLMSEILNGIKVLKLYAWEHPFGEMIRKIRFKEVTVLKNMAYYMAGVTFLWTCAPFLVALASFAMYVLIDENNILTANVAFVSISLFNLLRIPLNMLPNMVIALIQVSVSIKRLNKFLRGEEQDKTSVTHERLGNDAIVIEDGEFSWGSDEDKSALTDINLTVPKGKLVAVVGQVGSGKSSLISAILGELNKKKGKVNVQGSLAYVPQQAWIQNATVRDNILMYQDYNKSYYDQVLSACALHSDLEILSGGDLTEIGEKGINLSGGQKQRVSVARAVYHDSDLYLFDDPLSAVDSHVGKHMFDKVIGPTGALRSKTRVFVTNSIAYLPQCDSIVVLKNGLISEMGTYQELLSAKGAFSEFLMQYLSQGEDLDDENLEQLDDILAKVPITPELHRQISMKLSGSESESAVSLSSDYLVKRKRTLSRRRKSEQVVLPKKKETQKLIQVEGMETSEVKIGIYIAYVKQIGWIMGFMIIFFWVLSQAASVGSNVWLSEWSNDPLLPDGSVDLALRDIRLGVYGALGVAQGLGIMIGAFGMAYGSMLASTHLHNQMLDSVLRSPMSYFDTTPIGRIVNRFSKDVNTMDVNLSMNFRGWLMMFMQVLSTIIVDAIETPLIIIILIPAGVLYYFVQKVYIATSRQLKRLESVSRSPIYNHFSESVTGASSIRAYGVQNIFIDEINKRVDTNMVSYYPSVAGNRWLAVRLEFVGNIIVLFASLFAVLGGDLLDPGSVGLSVSYAMSITNSLNWMVRLSSELETNIVSVERILEYSELESEAEWKNDHLDDNESWPESGKIDFKSYKTKYRADLDLVLKGIDCSIQPGEKIGICGRTGAGKSSLTLALFRIIEAQGGSIHIDDIEISKLGLQDLRSRLTIIPQEPVLFSGNIRENLDPFSLKSDTELWSALEQAHLKTFISGLNDGLEYNVAEGGENFSVGQRQLICLARALLRKTKILILDEATAAVDLETDDLIQATIKKAFSDSTILTIAHRLNTIMDSTRVLVLDQGVIAEFETPQHLLQDKKSIFYGMARDAGLV